MKTRTCQLEASSFKLQASRARGGACSVQLAAARRGGFTLIELLVVIAILGILMSLVAAGAQTARRRAAVTKAKTTIAAL